MLTVWTNKCEDLDITHVTVRTNNMKNFMNRVSKSNIKVTLYKNNELTVGISFAINLLCWTGK